MDMNKLLYIYDDYMPYHLLSLTSETANLLEVCTPELLELIEYDKTKKTEYTMSLYYFIINNLNMQRTSDILHIHYNTLKYRLQRIEEFHSLDLSSELIQLNLRLSFLILEHVNKMDFISYMSSVLT
jgi:DNA-binding PucR family transcriptional regulator